MLIVDATNPRDIYCTVQVEFQVQETYDDAVAARNLYSTGLQLQESYPFIMDMIYYHDIVLSRAVKPLPPSLAHHAVLTARYSSLVAKKHDLPADSWQHQFMQFLKAALPDIAQFNKDDDFVALEPLVTVYHQPAKSFCLTS